MPRLNNQETPPYLILLETEKMKNIVDTLIEIGGFNTLLNAFESVGLTEELKKSGPYTVFAPQDSAFSFMTSETLENLLKDTPKLEQLLKLHILSGNYGLLELRKLSEKKDGENKVNSISGQYLKVTSTLVSFCANDLETVKIEKSVAIRPDTSCSNGIIHILDKVLMPIE